MCIMWAITPLIIPKTAPANSAEGPTRPKAKMGPRKVTKSSEERLLSPKDI